MRIDWVPYSASALVVGAAALSVGAIVVPQAGIPSSPLWIVEEQPASWLVVSGLYLLASVSLILGLPAVLSIFDLRGARAALIGSALVVVGCTGTAAYAVLLAVYRALSSGDLFAVGLQDLAGDPGLSVILYGWVLTFALGELLLALALVQAQRVQRWVPCAAGAPRRALTARPAAARPGRGRGGAARHDRLRGARHRRQPARAAAVNGWERVATVEA